MHFGSGEVITEFPILLQQSHVNLGRGADYDGWGLLVLIFFYRQYGRRDGRVEAAWTVDLFKSQLQVLLMGDFGQIIQFPKSLLLRKL